MLNRRQLLIFGSSLLASSSLVTRADEMFIDIHVIKNAQCGCCSAWVKILVNKGFNVTSENVSRDRLSEFKIESSIPKNMMSCHTAKIGGYFIEGHVPPSDIRRLIAERPDALGLAVPAMPYGSPGMGVEEEREAYDVFLIKSDGTSDLFQHYPKAGLLV